MRRAKLLAVSMIFLLIASVLVAVNVNAECPVGYFTADTNPNASWYNVDVDGTVTMRVAHTVDTATQKDCLMDVNSLGQGQHILKAQVCYQCTGANADPDCEWCGDWSDITAVKPGAASGLSFQW